MSGQDNYTYHVFPHLCTCFDKDEPEERLLAINQSTSEPKAHPLGHSGELECRLDLLEERCYEWESFHTFESDVLPWDQNLLWKPF